jgi:hypothetical protein
VPWEFIQVAASHRHNEAITNGQESITMGAMKTILNPAMGA